MTLKSTVDKKKPSPEEVKDVLRKVDMTDDQTPNTVNITSEKVNKTVKQNYILSQMDHAIYKLHCQINGVSMQDKATELILEWIAKQPKLGL